MGRAKKQKQEPIATKLDIDFDKYPKNQVWYYNDDVFDEIPPLVVGFVYLITNLITNKRYIGKKKLFSHKVRQVNKKKVKEPCLSDFMDYYGSSEQLKADIALLGKDNFKREILLLCESLTKMSYYEIKYQLQYDVIRYPDKWYNSFVGCRINRTHLKDHHYIDKLNDLNGQT